MRNKYNKLDNPAWYSLQETHRPFSAGYENVKFYHPDYCPFGGIRGDSHIMAQIDNYADISDRFFIIGKKPTVSDNLRLINELICIQMISGKEINLPITEEIRKLEIEDTQELIDLVTLVQPGYFKIKTANLGNYFGIFKNGHLVSVAGERMKMDGFVELSAIITHPSHTGKGYAKQLITRAANNIFKQGLLPYLHVSESNIAAISLYTKLGFRNRRKISFWEITK